MTQVELGCFAEEWQKRLRLRDWEIAAKFVRYFDLPREKVGTCHINADCRIAIISLLDPRDYNPHWLEPEDAEYTLIHEMLHIHFEPVGAKESTAEEQAIHALSAALLALKRGKE